MNDCTENYEDHNLPASPETIYLTAALPFLMGLNLSTSSLPVYGRTDAACPGTVALYPPENAVSGFSRESGRGRAAWVGDNAGAETSQLTGAAFNDFERGVTTEISGKIIGYLLMGLTVAGNVASYAAIFLKGYNAATNERHNLKWWSVGLWAFSAVTHVLGDAYILHYNENARRSKEFWSAEGLLIGFQAGECAYIALTW